jgi:predicted DNA-binding transcriptional regulator YafY
VSAPTAQTGTQRLQRLLALVPYVVTRNVVGLAETASAFGVSERELVDDLNLLWCVELRAPDPYCPIDLSYEGGEIVISEAESIAQVALPGSDALTRTIAKLEAAAGEAAAVSNQVQVQVDRGRADGVIGQVRDAVSQHRRIHLRYYVPGRDEATERDVDPMRLLVVEGRTYLEGWCRRAEGVRLFRLDRMHGLEMLDVPAEVPPEAEPVDVDQGLFRPSDQDVQVVLELHPGAHWVAEYYPCENIERSGDELRVTLRTPDTRWVRRLALRLGEDARVIAPAELAAEVGADAAAALAQYAS